MSGRDIDAAVLAALDSGRFHPVILVEMQFSGGTERGWTGIGDLIWDSKTFTGAGEIGEITPIHETKEVRATGMALGLKGLPSKWSSIALGEQYQNRPATVWLGFMNEAGTALLADPIVLADERMDQMFIKDGDDGKSTNIKITLESILVTLEKIKERRRTPEDQAIDDPDDKFFEYVAGLQKKELVL